MSEFNRDVGKPISKTDERKLIDNWQKTGMKTKSNFFGSHVFQKLLALPGAVGISIFNGMDDQGNMKPVLFAVDKEGRRIVSSTDSGISALSESDDDSGGYNASMTCPPYCTP